MSAESVALDHYQDQQRLSSAVAQVAADAWRQVDPDNIVRSWQALSPEVTVAAAGAQRAAAGQADSYLDEVLDAQDIPAGADGSVLASAFSGIASDGRPLDTLLAQPANLATYALASGHTMPRALAAGRASLDMMVRTQVADAGRTADQVSLLAHRSASGYVRMLVPPACSRCAILAGRWYRYSAGFQRHPRCDCRHIPSTENRARDLTTDPRAYFDSLSLEEQDRIFGKAGAQAIRDGADMSQVVNARRGMYTAGGRRFTTEGTTVRGLFGGYEIDPRTGGLRRRPASELVRRPGQRYRSTRGARLTPEQIYAQARTRDEAIEMLRANGYLRPAVPQVQRAPVRQAPVVARTAQQRLDDLVASVPANASRTPLAGGVSADVSLVRTPAGPVVHKRGRDWGAPDEVAASLRAQADAEYLAARVGQAIDAPVAAVARAGRDAVWVEYIDGAIPATAWVDSLAGQRIGLLDTLTANMDRNAGNILRRPDGSVVGIDHGWNWQNAPPVIRPGTTPSHAPSAKHFVSGDGERYIDNPLSQDDVDLLRSRLEALRPEFEAVGRGGWLDYTLSVLQKLRGYAVGVGIYG